MNHNLRKKMKFFRLMLIFIAMVSTNVFANPLAIDQVKFSNAWVKMPMPGMHMTAGFVDIENLSDKDIKLVAVRTPVSKVAELHTMVMVDKVMQMRQIIGGWVIASGDTLTLGPGGNHAMLMGLDPNLKNQTDVALEFNIEGMGWILVPAVVQAPKF